MSDLDKYFKECAERDRRQKSGGYIHPQPGVQNGINRRDLGALEIASDMAAAVRSCGEIPDPGEIAEFSYKLSDALIAEGKK